MKNICSILCLFIGLISFSQEDRLPKYGFKISNQGGFYKSSFNVKISADSNVRVFYTTDGSVPNSSSLPYTGNIPVKRITTLRIVGYLNGKRLQVNTQTYFTERAYTLPVFSITTDPDNLWSAGRGIYAKGCCADSVQPYYGANFWKGWERPMNIEMYEPDGSVAINQEAGIRIFGGWSKGLPQKSLTIIARKKYGKKKFKYKLLPKLDQKKYKTFILRNSGGDFNKAHLRDAYMTQLVEPIDLEIQEQRPAIVYLNGKYWGIHYIREKLNEHYLKAHFDVDKDSVSLLKHRGDRQHGKKLNYPKLIQFLKTHSLAEQKNMDYVNSVMDVENFIAYNIAETYSDNRDAGGNIRYWRESKEGGKWRWIFFDLDLGLNSNSKVGHKRNTVHKFTNANYEAWPDPAWSTLIIRKLLENEEARELYINMFADYLNSIFKEEVADKLLNEMAKAIEEEMPFHKKRWGGSMGNWHSSIELVRTFIQERPGYIREFIVEKFKLGGTVSIKVISPDKEVGDIQLNSLKIKDNFDGIYFKNNPIHLKVKPTVDYEFSGWKELGINELDYSFVPVENQTLTPEFTKKRASLFQGKLVVNEVFNKKDESWIEIYNTTNGSIDVSGFKIRDDKDKHVFVFPANTSIEAKGYLVISEGKVKSEAKTITGLDFSISDEDKVRLYDSEDFLIDEAIFESYLEDQGWIRINPEVSGKDNWKQGDVSIGLINATYQAILTNREDDEKRRQIILYGSIAGGALLLLLLILVVVRRSKKKKLTLAL